MGITEELRGWLFQPIAQTLHDFEYRVTNRLNRMERKFMSAVDDLNAAIEGQYEAMLPALGNVKSELERISGLLAEGASPEQLAQALANVNASTNRIVQAVSDVVANPATPDPVHDVPEADLPEVPVVGDGTGVEPESDEV